ncbi:hypothetical protein [Streptomyces sp. NPDC050121]
MPSLPYGDEGGDAFGDFRAHTAELTPERFLCEAARPPVACGS